MQRALVAIDDTDTHRRLLTDAAEFAQNGAAELVVLAWTTPMRPKRTTTRSRGSKR